MKFKLLLSLTLAVVMSQVSHAQAVGDIIEKGCFTYKYTSTADNNRTVCIVKVDGTFAGDEIELPTSVKDKEENFEYKVTDINCDFGNNTISHLIVPEGFTNISMIAGTNITKVTVPSTVSQITFTDGEWDNGFHKCMGLQEIVVTAGNGTYTSEDGVLFNKDKTELLFYPRNKPGTSYTIPSTVTKAGITPFHNDKIETLVLSENMTTLGNINFKVLKSITIPAKLESMASLKDCPALEEYIVKEGNKIFSSNDGVLLSKDGTELIAYPRGKKGEKYVVPGTVTVIKKETFQWNSIVRTIDMSLSKVETIEESALSHNMLNSVIWPSTETLKTIKENAFYDSKLAGEIVLPEPLNTIGKHAFGSTQIKSVSIPKTVGKIGDNPFYLCTEMEAITVDNDNPDYCDQDGILFSKKATGDNTFARDILIYYPINKPSDNYIIPDGTKIIGGNAFAKANKLKNITFPSSLNNIEGSAFSLCSALESITNNADNLQEIGSWAFGGCSKLKEFNVPASVKDIADKAFIGCSSLTSFTIPDGSQMDFVRTSWPDCTNLETFTIGRNTNIVSLGGSSLANLPNLKRINILEGNTKMKGIWEHAFGDLPELLEINIAEDCTIESIGTKAIANCPKLESVTLPRAVNSLGRNAFFNCQNLKHVTFGSPSSLEHIGDNAFQDCGLEDFTVPESVKTIDRQAFHNCTKLTTMRIPKGTTTIDPQAFYLCESLTNIDVPKENENYSSSDGILCNKGKTELVIFPAGKANDRFTLLPPSLESIGTMAFFECKKLKTVTIPKKVTKIGESAFWNCDNLTSICFLADEPIAESGLGNQAFPDDIATKATLYVRERNKSKYEDKVNHTYWSNFTDIRTSFTTGDGVEYLPVSPTTVNLLSANKAVNTLIINPTVTNSDGGKTYDVGLIGDYAFEDCNSMINEVVVFAPVKYIGAKAFTKAGNEDQIKNVFLIDTPEDDNVAEISTVKFDIDEQYNEFTANQKVYVKQSDLDSYRAKWGKFADMLSADIPYTQSTELGTFSREFPVDMSQNNWNERLQCPEVIAYTANVPEYQRVEEGYLHLRMESINVGQGRDKDGVYIPANTGVLIQAVSGATPGNFHYRIGEGNEMSYEGDNIMQPVTEVGKEIKDEDSYTYFFVNGKNLVRFSSVTMPVHRAYLKVDVPAGAKLAMSLTAPGTSATGITELPTAGTDGTDSGIYYDLRGIRTTSPARGIYIKDGKKVVINN